MYYLTPMEFWSGLDVTLK